MDRLFERMQADGFPFRQVAAISGSGQQHGSVYLRRGTRKVLRGLSPDRPLRDQVADCFAVGESPIWMDSSTTAQCRALEAALGGPQAVAELTGSRAYERFTGNQIAKLHATRPDAYAATERIALVSSFMASLLIGDYAPIDTADGAGMNLMNLRAKRWAAAALDATAPGLRARLGPIAPAHTAVGRVHAHFARRYGFRAPCLVIAFSGDNPNSLAGLRLERPGEVAVSMGTSDTMFGALSEPRPSASEGHIFANPVDPGGYMALICYKNGSLTREAVRDRYADGSWDAFAAALARTAPGNGGRIGFYLQEPEITPPILKTGEHRFGPDDRRVDRFEPDAEARAVVEGQFLSMRVHGGNIGIRPVQILATGGASANRALIRVMANVFGVPVFIGNRPNSASLGAAYRARHGWICACRRRFVPFAEVMAGAPPFRRAAVPDRPAHAVYTAMLARYARLEQDVIRT
jgi:xylulokinase